MKFRFADSASYVWNLHAWLGRIFLQTEGVNLDMAADVLKLLCVLGLWVCTTIFVLCCIGS